MFGGGELFLPRASWMFVASSAGHTVISLKTSLLLMYGISSPPGGCLDFSGLLWPVGWTVRTPGGDDVVDVAFLSLHASWVS